MATSYPVVVDVSFATPVTARCDFSRYKASCSSRLDGVPQSARRRISSLDDISASCTSRCHVQMEAAACSALCSRMWQSYTCSVSSPVARRAAQSIASTISARRGTDSRLASSFASGIISVDSRWALGSVSLCVLVYSPPMGGSHRFFETCTQSVIVSRVTRDLNFSRHHASSSRYGSVPKSCTGQLNVPVLGSKTSRSATALRRISSDCAWYTCLEEASSGHPPGGGVS